MSDEKSGSSGSGGGGGGWIDVGAVAELSKKPLHQVRAGNKTPIAVVCKDGEWSALSGVCNHVGGPLGEGTLEGDYVVCPWHQWKFHRQTGEGEPGFEGDKVPSYQVRVRDGRVEVDLKSRTKRKRAPHEPHRLAREIVREPGPVRVAGISTTVMDRKYPRFSTSDALLETALEHARTLGCGTDLIRLDELRFQACDGYYSKSAHACTWPCSITQMDPDGPVRPRLRGVRPLGRRGAHRDADPLGQCQQPLLQDGRADELHPEPGDHRRPRPAAQQGGRR